ncbi:MAG: DUF3040 domain-containing protein [Actinobacteria bacterium]|nr:DUF3040 domain-containing protein [Actinomycetota bacterium]MCB9412295.1 DUF3040 domain-containing protein [Actinomycetota bacterium]
MPLSEHEQRLLEQMERALYAEDPKFASTLRQPVIRQGSRKRMVLGVVVAALGLGLLLAGVAIKQPIVGVLGFVVMLGGAILAFTGGGAKTDAAPAGATSPAAAPAPNKRGRSTESGGFMDKMEDRWRHRHEGDAE